MLYLEKYILKKIPNIKISKATPIEIKKILKKNKNIPPSEYPIIIKSIKEQEKRGGTKKTQESLLNSSIQSWNNYYNVKSLPDVCPIRILPSDSENPRRSHMEYYYQVITVKEALTQGFFQNNCRCKFEFVEKEFLFD